jgi:hypothetical protein
VLRDNIADYGPQAIVALGGGGKGESCSRRKVVVVPILDACAKELLSSELLKALDVVLIANLIHLRME